MIIKATVRRRPKATQSQSKQFDKDGVIYISGRYIGEKVKVEVEE